MEGKIQKKNEAEMEEENANQVDGVIYEVKRAEDGKPILIIICQPMEYIPFDKKVKLVW